MRHRLPNDIQELGQTPLFRDLSKRELDAVQRLGTVVDRGAGERLCRIDQASGQIGVIVSGEVAATTADGRRRHLRPGDSFGSIKGSRRVVELEEIEAVTSVTVFVVGRRELGALREVCPRLAARLTGARAASPAPSRARVEARRSYPVPATT